MRHIAFFFLTASVGIALACSDRFLSADRLAQRGTWGSSAASLIINDSATLEIPASGFPNCFGAYGVIQPPILSTGFALPGTYTRLTGTALGNVRYAAQYSGLVDGNQMSLTVSVPALHQTLGPFTLTHGVNKTWPPCEYP